MGLTEDSFHNYVTIAEYAFAVIVFVSLFFRTAEYGRHVKETKKIMLDARLCWMVMEFPAVLMQVIYYYKGQGWKSQTLTIFFLTFELHYIYRTFVYPLLLNKNAKKTPIEIPLLAILFNVMNGYVLGYGLYIRSDNTRYTEDWIESPRFIFGQMMFLAGFIINIHSDHVLRTLRKPGESGYKIPQRGLHRLVANPNYLGELMEWGGYSIMTWSIYSLAFFAFTFANLVPRAYTNLKWYRQKFPGEYPSIRKAVFPFIF